MCKAVQTVRTMDYQTGLSACTWLFLCVKPSLKYRLVARSNYVPEILSGNRKVTAGFEGERGGSVYILISH